MNSFAMISSRIFGFSLANFFKGFLFLEERRRRSGRINGQHNTRREIFKKFSLKNLYPRFYFARERKGNISPTIKYSFSFSVVNLFTATLWIKYLAL